MCSVYSQGVQKTQPARVFAPSLVFKFYCKPLHDIAMTRKARITEIFMYYIV